MDELRSIRAWYRYNADLRPRYLEAIARVPPKIRTRDEGASYPLFEIFLHVLDAYRWWFRYVSRDQVRDYHVGRFRTHVRSLRGARRAMTRTSREVLRFVNRLNAKDLNRVIQYSAPVNDAWTSWQRERITLRAMLWHMVEEELQHRGEMNALLWRHGVEPPIVGFEEWSHAKRVVGPPASNQ
jgi:uncharacterized damage-inducible protein DinB